MYWTHSNKTGKGKEKYIIALDKEMVHKGMNALGQFIGNASSHILAHFGPGISGGTAGAAMVKSTSGMAPVPRVALVAATTAATAAATQVGVELSKAITKKTDVVEMIKQSEHSNPDPNRVPSPDPNIINSPLEDVESVIPLVGLLENLTLLNVAELLLIIVMFIIIFSKNINGFYIKIISYIVNKYIVNKYL